MGKEQFFRKRNGKLAFVGHKCVGVSNAVDPTETHERIAKHFCSGDGWPQGVPPASAYPENVWAVLRST